MRLTSRWLMTAVFAFCCSAAHAQQQVVIVTSFPKELTEAYKKAFESRNPGIRVEILNKPTPVGVAYIREAPAANKPDVFWVSAPDAFEVLAACVALGAEHRVRGPDRDPEAAELVGVDLVLGLADHRVQVLQRHEEQELFVEARH